jgi:hypothetical protein
LGLEVDTTAMEVRIPENKIRDILATIEIWLRREKVTLRETQSLLGKLNFACRAIVPGRAFSRRLIDATCGVVKPHHRIRLTAALKEDLKIWSKFLGGFNGRCIMLENQWCDSEALNLYTDAAGAVGFGAYFQGQWVCGTWPDHWMLQGTPDITFKELFPIVLALQLWAKQMENTKVVLFCDNQAVVHIINKQSTRAPHSMALLRQLVLTCLNHNILCRAKHIPGHNNSVADALSRGQLEKFKRLAPGADPHPAAVPDSLLQLFKLK